MFHPDYHVKIANERNADMLRAAEIHRKFKDRRDGHLGRAAFLRSRMAVSLIALGNWLMPHDAEVAVTEA